jgi:hypothetical protein
MHDTTDKERIMKRSLTIVLTGLTLAAAVIAAAAVLQLGAGPAAAAGPSGGNGPGPASHVPSDPSVALTAADATGLQHMSQDEKLAHDVYTQFAASYDVRVFENIARSESRHMAALERLMDVYDVSDPVAGVAAGSFSDPAFSRLYASLTAQGRQSPADALRAGVTIEQLDIEDLEARIAATDRADLKAVYGNLLRASQNHLRTFQRALGAL